VLDVIYNILKVNTSSDRSTNLSQLLNREDSFDSAYQAKVVAACKRYTFSLSKKAQSSETFDLDYGVETPRDLETIRDLDDEEYK